MGKDQSLNLPYPLILASTSRYRSALLTQLGWAFDSLGPDVDEEPLKQKGLLPGDLAQKLSYLKAQNIFEKNQHACVIGSDQVCMFENKILSKPKTIDRACEQLAMMQGKPHELLTAVTVIHPRGEETFLNQTILKMRPLTTSEIEAYINADMPLDCAGSYKLESRGIKLFESIKMNDHTAIIGLPLIQLTNSLLKIGYPL